MLISYLGSILFENSKFDFDIGLIVIAISTLNMLQKMSDQCLYFHVINQYDTSLFIYVDLKCPWHKNKKCYKS